MGRRAIPKSAPAAVSVFQSVGALSRYMNSAADVESQPIVAWRPVWCSGFDTKEDGTRVYHHMTGLPCKCKPGPQIQALWSDHDEVALLGGRGSAKGQPMWAKVLTPRGWTEMRDIKVGTQICNPDGTLAKVIQIHPLGVKKIFKVTTADGGVTHVTDDHRWLAKLTMRNTYRAECKYYPFGDGDGVNARIYTTEFLAAHLEQEKDKGHRLRSNVLIPLTQPTVCFKHAKYKPWEKVHPYLVGVLIGDGCLTQSVRFSSEDQHIVDRIAEVCQHGKVVHDNGYNYRISSDGDLEREMKRLGLYGKSSHEKSIPDGYLWAPVEQRLELLRGLMDTDGCVDKQGHPSYCTTSEQLAKDVKHLVESLGGRATISGPCVGRYKKDGVVFDCRDYWKLYIQIPRPSEIFSLPRKKARCIDIFNGGVSTLQRRIVSIEYVGDEEAQCISVDHPNQLYITDDHIVTHNSEATFGFLLKGNFKPTGHPCDVSYINHRDYRFLVLRSTSEDLEEYFTRFKQIAEPLGGVFTENPRRVRFPSGAEGLFFHMGDDTWRKSQGRSFVRIVMEEATHVQEKVLIEFVKANRTKHERHMKCQIMLTANPNGPGLAWVNARYRYPHGAQEPWPSNQTYTCPVTGRTRVYIHSTADDNPYFLEGNASYIRALDSLKTYDEAEYRRMRHGDFDVVESAFFTAFRKKHREGEPENALHVVEPFALAPWWPRAIGVDWGYSHATGVVFGCWTPAGRLVLYREMKVSKMTPKQLGGELARKALKDLEGLPSKHMMVHLSHDAFHRESGPVSEADQIAEGIAEVLGTDAAFVYAPTEDEKMLAPDAAWASVKRRQSQVSRKTVLTLVPAGGTNKRRMAYNLMRDYMRWTPLVEKEFDEDYARQIMLTEGALAYTRYRAECDKAKAEPLPVLQIFNTLPHLIQEIEAMQENPKNTEEPLKQDGDDVVDGCAYLIHGFKRTEEEIPREVQLQMKMDALHPNIGTQARVMAARHWESELGRDVTGAFNIPRAVGPTRRHWMAGRAN